MLYQSVDQRQGKSISGLRLMDELSGLAPLNACDLEYLLANQHLVPHEWDDYRIFFPGTVFSDEERKSYLRSMLRHRGRWQSADHWLEWDWAPEYVMAIQLR
jgi:hypothetical protein